MEDLDSITLSPTYAYCMLCSCGVTELKWTERFRACKFKAAQPQFSILMSRAGLLFLNRANLSDEFICPFGRLASNYCVRLADGRNAEIRARTRITISTPTDLYLIHTSCLHLLQSRVENDISPTQLFCLCQSLQRDLSRNFGEIESEEARTFRKYSPVASVITGC